MSKRIEVPADLEHLIEKREEEKDRRSGSQERRWRPGENSRRIAR